MNDTALYCFKDKKTKEEWSVVADCEFNALVKLFHVAPPWNLDLVIEQDSEAAEMWMHHSLSFEQGYPCNETDVIILADSFALALEIARFFGKTRDVLIIHSEPVC